MARNNSALGLSDMLGDTLLVGGQSLDMSQLPM
jgi:hypothetical protein